MYVKDIKDNRIYFSDGAILYTSLTEIPPLPQSAFTPFQKKIYKFDCTHLPDMYKTGKVNGLYVRKVNKPTIVVNGLIHKTKQFAGVVVTSYLEDKFRSTLEHIDISRFGFNDDFIHFMLLGNRVPIMLELAYLDKIQSGLLEEMTAYYMSSAEFRFMQQELEEYRQQNKVEFAKYMFIRQPLGEEYYVRV